MPGYPHMLKFVPFEILNPEITKIFKVSVTYFYNRSLASSDR